MRQVPLIATLAPIRTPSVAPGGKLMSSDENCGRHRTDATCAVPCTMPAHMSRRVTENTARWCRLWWSAMRILLRGTRLALQWGASAGTACTSDNTDGAPVKSARMSARGALDGSHCRCSNCRTPPLKAADCLNCQAMW